MLPSDCLLGFAITLKNLSNFFDRATHCILNQYYVLLYMSSHMSSFLCAVSKKVNNERKDLTLVDLISGMERQ